MNLRSKVKVEYFNNDVDTTQLNVNQVSFGIMMVQVQDRLVQKILKFLLDLVDYTQPQINLKMKVLYHPYVL